MEHILYIQKLKKGKRKQYTKDHKECWPELLEAIKESGIERNIIWLYGDEILIYTMSENFNGSMAKLSRKKIFKDWIRRMKNYLEVIQDFSSKGKVIKLEKIFDLEEQINKIY
jgi:L-rhamnose mutarotase